MTLKFQDLKKKIEGCWLGKNIGGVLGAPFEGKRGVFDIQFYTQDLTAGPPANDDLDLQLVWLNAAEKWGRQLNAEILGAYWRNHVAPNWSEYGVGKNNLSAGLIPPLSGVVRNNYGESAGAFIRSEIWACLAPGNPELATRYAYEDAIVDHYGDGVYAEIFCAALQSSAFVEGDKRKLVEIALSYIPEDCKTARAVKIAIESYDSGRTWQEARIDIMNKVPGAFGAQFKTFDEIPNDVPYGTAGDDAANNIGLMMIAWLYGEDDFGKTICIAASCGEDADCTCATVGATLGIIHGIDNIPQKWIEPLGDKIKTVCVNWINNCNAEMDVPTTTTQLTDRVLKLIPRFLDKKEINVLAEDRYEINVQEGDKLFCDKGGNAVKDITMFDRKHDLTTAQLVALSPYTTHHNFVTFNATFDYNGEPFITKGQSRKVKLTVYDTGRFSNFNQQWITIKAYCDNGIEILPNNQASVFLATTYEAKSEAEFEIVANEIHSNKVEILFDLAVMGTHTHETIKAVFIVNG